jgi:hypothetical protein
MEEEVRMKTYTLTCPDPDCAESFDIELDPTTLTDEGELIECPECLEEWEWEYDAVTGILALLPDEDEDEEDEDDDEAEDMQLVEDEDEDEDEDKDFA